MSGAFEFARRSGAQVVHRHEPATLTLTICDLATADGHTLSASFTVTAKLHDRRADLLLFDEQFLSGTDVVTLNDLRQFLVTALRSSLEVFASQHELAASFKQRETIQTLLLQRSNAVGFGCGLEFFPPLELQLSSESLRSQQLNDRREREQVEVLERADRLAAKLKSIGEIHRLPIAEQSALLPSLLQNACPVKTAVHIAAGDQLLTLDPATLSLAIEQIPAEIGLLRSVRVIDIEGKSRRVAGGQRGLCVFDADGQTQSLFLHETRSSRGINSIAWSPHTRELVAAHGEVGLIAWHIDQPASSRTVVTPPDVRWLQAIDERLVFSAGASICVFNGASVSVISDAGSRVGGLLAFEFELWVVREDGVIDRFDRTTLQAIGHYQNPSPIHCAAPFTEAGLRAAFIGGPNGEVDCITASGEILMRLPKSVGVVRMLATTGAHVIGVSSDRSSVIIWHAAEPQSEPRTLNILARTGHRIADIRAR